MSSVRPWRDIMRRESRQIMVGNVPILGCWGGILRDAAQALDRDAAE